MSNVEIAKRLQKQKEIIVDGVAVFKSIKEVPVPFALRNRCIAVNVDGVVYDIDHTEYHTYKDNYNNCKTKQDIIDAVQDCLNDSYVSFTCNKDYRNRFCIGMLNGTFVFTNDYVLFDDEIKLYYADIVSLNDTDFIYKIQKMINTVV